MNTDSLFEWLSLYFPLGRSWLIANRLERELGSGDIHSVLDVGCGCGKFSIFRKYDSTGCDIFPNAIGLAQKNGNYRLLVLLDVNSLPFPDKSFDAVTCLDVVEHLEKEDAVRLIEKMERIARKLVFIQTPWGYDNTYMAGYFLHENPHMKHLSGWNPK